MAARSAETISRPQPGPDRGKALEDRVGTIDRIARFEGAGLPVVSLYLALTAGEDGRGALRTKADSLLHGVRSLAHDHSLDHDVRESLRGDIVQIKSVLRTEVIGPGTLAVFSCSGARLLDAVRLPRALRDRIMVDATPWMGPMLAILDQHHRCGAVVVDRGSAHVWELYLGELRDAGRVVDRALRNHASAGWHGLPEGRVRNRADELSRRHYRQVAAALAQLVRAERFDVLAVGGHDHELPAFLEFLPRSLRERVAGTFSIDPRTATAATVRPYAEAILDRYEFEEQRRSVAEAFEVAASGGLATVGIDACLWAGSVAAVRALLVQDGAVVPGVICDASGWFGTSGEACPLCGRPTRRTPDVLDELVEAVIDEGGSIQHVRADTELRERLTAARLRFALPPGPEQT